MSLAIRPQTIADDYVCGRLGLSEAEIEELEESGAIKYEGAGDRVSGVGSPPSI